MDNKIAMDFQLIEYFLRVVELGSINKAASSLGLSQPSLSRHISALEHMMGSKLFTRTQSGVQLTESGQLLSEKARPLLRQFTMLKEQVAQKANGQLAIGIPPSWKYLFTAPFVEKLTSQFPGIALRVYEGVSNVLREYMFGRLLDLAVVPFNTTPVAGYRQTALVREPMVIVGRAQDGLQQDHPVNLSYVSGLKLVLPGKPNVARVQLEHALERKGMTFSIAVETDTLSLNLDLVSRGVGFTVVPACSLHGHGLGDTISWAPIKGQYVTWALCENEDRLHSTAMQEGRKLAMRTVMEALEKEVWVGAEAVGALE
ncbi:MAG: LysR family transcriptional regulator [Pseudomonadota bacterium]